jgi:hypothetical protein
VHFNLFYLSVARKSDKRGLLEQVKILEQLADDGKEKAKSIARLLPPKVISLLKP